MLDHLWVAEITITVIHRGYDGAEGLDEVLANIVRSWDYEHGVTVNQLSPYLWVGTPPSNLEEDYESESSRGSIP